MIWGLKNVSEDGVRSTLADFLNQIEVCQQTGRNVLYKPTSEEECLKEFFSKQRRTFLILIFFSKFKIKLKIF
jgi:hypothetical protein